MVVSFIGGGNRSTQRKPLTLSQVTDNLNVVSSIPRWSGIQIQNISEKQQIPIA
jgi:hypothetical protein